MSRGAASTRPVAVLTKITLLYRRLSGYCKIYILPISRKPVSPPATRARVCEHIITTPIWAWSLKRAAHRCGSTCMSSWDFEDIDFDTETDILLTSIVPEIIVCRGSKDNMVAPFKEDIVTCFGKLGARKILRRASTSYAHIATLQSGIGTALEWH